MKFPLKSIYICVLATSLGSIGVLAQAQSRTGAEASAGASNAQVAGLEPITENGVTYLCGGIGQDEQASMKKMAGDYDLMMSFAASNGAYLADVNVEIDDAKGQNVLSASCDGPLMLVDLPKGGNYRVRAEAGGRTLTRTAAVRESGAPRRLALSWPVQTVDMGLSPEESRGASGSTGSDDTSDAERMRRGEEMREEERMRRQEEMRGGSGMMPGGDDMPGRERMERAEQMREEERMRRQEEMRGGSGMMPGRDDMPGPERMERGEPMPGSGAGGYGMPR